MSIPAGDFFYRGSGQQFVMDELDELMELRRKRLRDWIARHYQGKQVRVINKTGINQGELSGLLKHKVFGEKKARSLETMLEMPPFWLDKPYDEDSERSAEWDKIVWLWNHKDAEISVMFGLLAGAMYQKKRRQQQDNKEESDAATEDEEAENPKHGAIK